MRNICFAGLRGSSIWKEDTFGQALQWNLYFFFLHTQISKMTAHLLDLCVFLVEGLCDSLTILSTCLEGKKLLFPNKSLIEHKKSQKEDSPITKQRMSCGVCMLQTLYLMQEKFSTF